MLSTLKAPNPWLVIVNEVMSCHPAPKKNVPGVLIISTAPDEAVTTASMLKKKSAKSMLASLNESAAMSTSRLRKN